MIHDSKKKELFEKFEFHTNQYTLQCGNQYNFNYIVIDTYNRININGYDMISLRCINARKISHCNQQQIIKQNREMLIEQPPAVYNTQMFIQIPIPIIRWSWLINKRHKHWMSWLVPLANYFIVRYHGCQAASSIKFNMNGRYNCHNILLNGLSFELYYNYNLIVANIQCTISIKQRKTIINCNTRCH